MLPINEKKIKIDLSAAAFEQICLIMENDYTLEGHFFRLKIDGKGCDGFTYATGFSQKLDDDIVLTYQNKGKELNILIDPFASFYCEEGILDYLLSANDGEDGFTFINKNEDKYHGKFFKDGQMVPPSKVQS